VIEETLASYVPKSFIGRLMPGEVRYSDDRTNLWIETFRVGRAAYFILSGLGV
jgi:hypothetical protein